MSPSKSHFGTFETCRRTLRMSVYWGRPEAIGARLKRRFCEGLRMPARDDCATHSGAGVRKPSMEETAGGVAKLRVRRYGDFGTGGLLPTCIERLFGKRSKGWRARSADRDRQNRRRAAEIDRRGGCPGRRDGEHGHCWSRAGEAEVQHWNVAADRLWS